MARRRSQQKTDVQGFYDALVGVLNEYGEEVWNDTRQEVIRVAEETRKNVESNIEKAGINGTKYKNSIRVKRTKGRRLMGATIYSPEHYQLTHLLENGHRLIYFGRDTHKETKARPHWEQAEAEAIKQLEQGIERVVEG